MKKDRFKKEEKRLCRDQENICKRHISKCRICQESMKEFEQFGISNTPSCKQYREQLEAHVKNCMICSQATNNFKQDMISITPEMREIVGELKKGNIFSVDPMKLKKVARQIFGKLDMSSDEIKDSQDKANKAVRDGFDKDGERTTNRRKSPRSRY